MDRATTGVLCLLLLSGAFLEAATQDIARLNSAQGAIERRLSPEAVWSSAQVGTLFQPSNGVRVGTNSRCSVLFYDGILVRLNENSLLEFKGPPNTKANRMLRMESGAAYFFTREPKQVPKIETPLVSLAVRGTEFALEVEPDQTIVSVLNGAVECRNEQGFLTVGAGEQAITARGRAPVKRILLRPLDTVQWALYYPAVLSFADYADFLPGATPQQRAGWDALQRGQLQAADQQFTGNDWRDAMGRSLAAYKRGDFTRAFGELDAIIAPRPASVHLYHTALHLALGQVNKAEAALEQAAQAIQPAGQEHRSLLFAAYLSEKAIIALTTNQKQEALALAWKALEANTHSSAAVLAMSYAQQARFNLREALRWAEESVRLSPENGLTYARLAELQLGFGEIEKAYRTAVEAREIAPEDARVSTVLGFVHLTRYDTTRAIEAFRKAITLDDAAGLPHLGLGLALIRQNKLEEGRRELEVAVHLEPNDSSFRSYLGKAYFEEDRYTLVPREYEMAKRLDPLDPTPHLYEAYYKLATHRPVEALWAIEESIRRNDNRAVYRSRLMLDQDQAVRSAGLSESFRIVGFSEAARIEAVKSMNRDYSNPSAHLLLTDTAFHAPRFDQAANSELLIWRLLTPLNVNSTRSEASFNEYTSLFDRQRLRLFLEGEFRSADQYWDGSVRQAGAFERFAYRVRYDQQHLSGFRNHDWERSRDGSVLGLIQLNPRDTVSFETTLGRREEGDLGLGLDPWRENPSRRSDFDDFEQRVGYHHRFGPGLHFISQALYIDREASALEILDRSFALSLVSEGVPLATLPDSFRAEQAFHQRFKGARGDGQVIWDSPLLSLVVGGGAFDAEAKATESGFASSDSLGLLTSLTLSSAGHHPERSQRAYVYSTWHAAPWMDMTAGGAYTRLELASVSLPPPFTDETRIESKFSPKLAASVYLTPQTTLRAAYFSSLSSASIIDLESIEPTQVGGFTQLIDELPGTRAETIGIGLDHKFSKRAYCGVETTRRKTKSDLGLARITLQNDLSSGDLLASAGSTLHEELSVNEDLVRLYWYQVLHRTLTGTIDYTLADRFDRFFDREAQTHRVRLGLNHFRPSGWFLRAAGTWRSQDLETFRASEEGAQDFWIMDASVGYQLPKRHGLVSLTVANLFDQDFRHEPSALDSRLIPVRSVNLKVSLNF